MFVRAAKDSTQLFAADHRHDKIGKNDIRLKIINDFNVRQARCRLFAPYSLPG